MSKVVKAVFKGVGEIVGGLLGGSKEAKVALPQAPAAPPKQQAAVSPNTQAANRSAQRAATGGYGGTSADTFLTGTEGVKKDELALGKNTLLGA